MPVLYVDAGAAAQLFQHKVLRLRLDAQLIDEERVAMVLVRRSRINGCGP